MAQIKMYLDDLKDCSSSLDSRIAELEGLNKKYENIIVQVATNWEGKACSKYVSLMSTYSANTSQLIELIRSFKHYVEEASSRAEAADYQSSCKIANIF